MSLRTILQFRTRPSRIKRCALLAFTAVRKVQAKAAAVPAALNSVREDVVSAWQESAKSLPKA